MFSSIIKTPINIYILGYRMNISYINKVKKESKLNYEEKDSEYFMNIL